MSPLNLSMCVDNDRRIFVKEVNESFFSLSFEKRNRKLSECHLVCQNGKHVPRLGLCFAFMWFLNELLRLNL